MEIMDTEITTMGTAASVPPILTLWVSGGRGSQDGEVPAEPLRHRASRRTVDQEVGPPQGHLS